MPAKILARIDSEVPFGDFIYWTLHFGSQRPFESVVEAGYHYERSYLAWEEVRKYRNPYFNKGTGFEGYLIGLCLTADEALENILKIGHEMLLNITHLHPFDHRFQSRLFKTLTGEVNDLRAMSEWSAEFGAMLARLRCNVSSNRQAKQFYTETYQIVQWLPHINYQEDDHTIKQHYQLVNRSSQNGTVAVDTHLLKPSEQEAWFVCASIGKFGHPLIREVMDLTTR